MSIRDVSDAQVWVSATGGAGTYALIEDLTSFDATHGSESETRTRVFGAANPYIRQGDDTDEYSLGGLYNPNDTDGQNILRTAHDNGTTVFIAILYDATGGAEQGYTQECRVTEYGESGEADGEYIECTFSAVGVGDRTTLGGGGLP